MEPIGNLSDELEDQFINFEFSMVNKTIEEFKIELRKLITTQNARLLTNNINEIEKEITGIRDYKTLQLFITAWKNKIEFNKKYYKNGAFNPPLYIIELTQCFMIIISICTRNIKNLDQLRIEYILKGKKEETSDDPIDKDYDPSKREEYLEEYEESLSSSEEEEEKEIKEAEVNEEEYESESEEEDYIGEYDTEKNTPLYENVVSQNPLITCDIQPEKKCELECADVLAFLNKILSDGVEKVPSNITRFIDKQLEGGSGNFRNIIYPEIVKRRKYENLVFTKYQKTFFFFVFFI
jgi:hypothetical protein